MSITAVPNSPIGWSDSAQTALQPKDSRYCQPWGVTAEGVEHDMNFQLQFGKVGYDISGGGALVPYYTGNTTSVGASQIIDSGASFASPPALSQHIAVNTDTGDQTTLNSPPVAGLTALDINDDIFGAGTSGDGYAVVAIRLPAGNVLYNGTDETISFSPNISENSFIIEDFFPNITNRFAVEVDIEDYSGGSLQVLAGSYPVTFTVLDDKVNGQKNGTISFYGIPSGADLQIRDVSQESNYTIAGIRIYYVSRPEVFVYQDGLEIDEIDPTSYIHNRALFTVDILSYGIGCYVLYANNVNGIIGRVNFPDQASAWYLMNVGTGWAFVADELVHTAGGAVGTNIASYEVIGKERRDCNYVIYFKLAVGSDVPSVSIFTGSETVNVSSYLVGATGPNYYINIFGYNIDIVTFSATEVDNVTIEQFNIYNTFYNEEGGYFSPNLTEEVTQLRVAPNFCTPHAFVCVKDLNKSNVLYESSITNDAATAVKKKDRWLPASSTYTERCFVQSNVRFARYQDDQFEAYRDSEGTNRIVYSDRVKVQECQIAPVPVWVHDWMTWAIRNDFEVNGVAYYPIEGSYSPNWQRDTPNAPAVFEIAAQGQDIKTTGCD